MLKLSRNADNACRRETAARGAHRERRGASVKRVPRRERRSCNRLVTERRRTRTRPGVVVTETGPGAPGRVRKPGSQFLSVRPPASGYSRSGSRFDRTNHPEPMILIGSVRSFKIPCPRTAKVPNRFPPHHRAVVSNHPWRVPPDPQPRTSRNNLSHTSPTQTRQHFHACRRARKHSACRIPPRRGGAGQAPGESCPRGRRDERR